MYVSYSQSPSNESGAQDLAKQLEFGARVCRVSIVLRAWLDELVDRPEFEFRCFSHRRQLNAVTQYFCWMHFPELCAREHEIRRRLERFFAATIAPHAPYDSFVVDLYLTADNEVRIIEFNPFHHGAGAGLFSWAADRERFLNGPLEMRIVRGDDDGDGANGNARADSSSDSNGGSADHGNQARMGRQTGSAKRVVEDQVPIAWMRWIRAHLAAVDAADGDPTLGGADGSRAGSTSAADGQNSAEERQTAPAGACVLQ
jgi:hypothetical protein